MRGGIFLIVSNLFVSFSDGVIWFVKVLFMLYAGFFIFVWLRTYDKWLAWGVFIIVIVGIQILSRYLFGHFTSLGIPFFFVGVCASCFKKVNWKCFNLALLPLAIYGLFAIVLRLDCVVLINVAFISCLLVWLTKWSAKIACPAFLVALSFDIYLIHNKVLMVGRSSEAYFSVLQFLFFTLVATLFFHVLRVRFMKLVGKIC